MSALWDSIVGQDRAKAVLEQACTDPSAAYLLVGPPGVGKSAAAKIFAASIICDDTSTDCPVCSRVLRDLHPDVGFFQPEGFTFPVDTIREMIASASLTPMEAKRRVFIVEQADRILERSQNALLKGLEEPTASVTWVLVADSIDPFLPTVLSRCQTVEFSTVTEDAIRQVLEGRFGLPSSESEEVVRFARGDLRRAMSLASDPKVRALRSHALGCFVSVGSSQAAFEAADAVASLAAEVRAEAEMVQAKEVEELDAALGSGRGTASVKKKLTDKHKRALRRIETEVFSSFLDLFANGCRDLAAISAGAGVEVIINTDHAAELLEASVGKTAGEWLDLAEAAGNARIALLENANAGLVVEAILLNLVGHETVESMTRA